MSRSLREFQVEALSRIAQQNLYLAAKPGAGKTAVALHAAWEAIYERFTARRVLVVAPLRVVPQYAEEAAKWGLALSFSQCLGPEPERLEALQASTDVLVVSHEHFPWLVRNVRHWNFDLVVFDEASRLRKGGRQGSVGWKMMNAIRKKKAPRILLMSGSPRPGTAHELYAPVYLLDGGQRLGHTLTGFRERFLTPNKVDRRTGRVFSWKLREGAEHDLYPLIADLFYAATPDLGLRFVEIDRRIVLPEEVMLQINRMQREMVADFIDEEITAGSLGVVSGKLQQMGNGEVFNDHGGTTVTHDCKVQDLHQLIEELDGEPLITVYWYTHELERLKQAFPDAVDITTTKGLAAAKAGKVQHALLQPGSAAHGIDGLQYHFSAMYWYSLPHSYELYDQTIKRIVRSGRGEETARIFRAIAPTDVRIREALVSKQVQQERFYDFIS
jgi:hypothetical protein